jgi:diguanylate cyclase (GGDEF)-like protein
MTSPEAAIGTGFYSQEAHESLLQFLYRAPIGLIQTTLSGDIEIMNPMAASLLMPLSGDGSLDNLFVALSALAPDLRARADAVRGSSAIVCEGLRLTLEMRQGVRSRNQVLELGILKMDASCLMASLVDVTLDVERMQRGMARRLRDATLTDSLTGLPNREAVCEQLSKVLTRSADEAAGSYAVLFINCDRFKQVNDTLGTGVGDAWLKLMADRFRAVLRQRTPASREQGHGDLAGRVGGDEFVVVLDGLRQPDDVHVVAQRLLYVLSQPHVVGGRPVRCDVSMGVVLQAHADADANAVLQQASVAMNEAKQAGGKRCTVYEPIMRERAARRGSIEADLRVALDEDQLFVVYQPILGLQSKDGRKPLAGVEALVRWRHPQRGIVSPIEFIHVAESCGLIDDLGRFVLNRACRDFMRWRADLGERAPRWMAVNLSRAQLGEPGLVASVQATLVAHGMPPAALQLEVTESLAAQDDQVQQRLRDLKALGLTLALDDFGTGYSSLASLHLLPVDVVKIDRSFVSQVGSSAHHRVLVEATVKVASSLGMGTVAEGIETEDQAQVVTQLGCMKGQGYLFSRPLPAADLVAWLAPDPVPVEVQ